MSDPDLEKHYKQTCQLQGLSQYSFQINLEWMNDLYGLDDHLISQMSPIKTLGGGGMKDVLLVNDPQCQRSLAMAKLKEEYKNPDYIDSFLTEARLLANLEHPGIVPIHHLGCDENGLPCFTMPWLKGRPLSDALKDPRTQSLDWRINTFCKIIEAIDYAHSQGVLHLDIQPNNIICDRYGEVQLIDWGVSTKIQDLPQSEDQAQKVVVGTSGFMSPEQYRGETWTWGCHSDVYALGKIFELCLQNISVPKPLTNIIKHATQEKIEERYASTSDMLNDLLAFKSNQIMHFEKNQWTRIISLWAKRHKIMIRWVLITSSAVMFLIAFTQRELMKAHHKEKSMEQKAEVQTQIQRLMNINQADQMIQKARQLFENQQKGEALRICSEVLAYHPNSKFALIHLAFHALTQKDFIDAIDLFTRAELSLQADIASNWAAQDLENIQISETHLKTLFDFSDGQHYRAIHQESIQKKLGF